LTIISVLTSIQKLFRFKALPTSDNSLMIDIIDILELSILFTVKFSF